jgi:predicted deacylase
VETPVIVTAGREPGPTLCVVAGIHGDEINGVEIVRRLMAKIDPERLQGNLVAIPIANIAAFRRGSRYLPDRRDLNRFFPGRPFGSSASRIAHALFTQVIERCDGLIDLHTGSFLRTNVHQLRADLSHEGTAMLAHQYGAEVIVHHRGGGGTLRRAATDTGIPAVTVEAGQPSRFDRTEVEKALQGLNRVLVARGMLEGDETAPPAPPSVTYFRTSWTRSDQGGILVSQVELGDEVNEGDILGTISDPLSGDIESIRAPHAGQIIGMAFDQLVMPGFAAYHLGLRSIPGSPLPDPSSESPEDRDETDHADPDSADLEERPE